MLNLIMAVIWMLLGIGMILWSWQSPDKALRIRGMDFSLGWLGIVLSLYNLARWWGSMSYRRRRRAEQEADLQRQRDYRRAHPEPPTEPNPDFDFTTPSSSNIQERPPQ